MVLTRCRHCGVTADTDVVGLTHKSTCRSPGKDIDNEILEKPKAAKTVSTSPKTISSFSKSKKTK